MNKTLAIIKTRQKLACLKKNFNSLLLRLKEKMRKYFNRFKTNTGIRKLVLINVQLSFFDENRDIISRDKYSIIEINDNPGYSINEWPYEGKVEKIGVKILKLLNLIEE